MGTPTSSTMPPHRPSLNIATSTFAPGSVAAMLCRVASIARTKYWCGRLLSSREGKQLLFFQRFFFGGAGREGGRAGGRGEAGREERREEKAGRRQGGGRESGCEPIYSGC